MKTIWGEQLDKDNLFGEYPRPQLRRESWLNLCGVWDGAITASDEPPAAWDFKILVPFSPESELSGVGRAVGPRDRLWYRRALDLPAAWLRGRVLLHFGAVDQCADVWLGHVFVGSHTGGFTSFTLDLTEALRAGETELRVRVRDLSDTASHSRSKQKTNRGGIWYTPQSGIWQPVWLEPVPERYIQRLCLRPLFDENRLEVTVRANFDGACSLAALGVSAVGRTNEPVRLALPPCAPWSPEHPALHDLTVRAGEDAVESYFAMRKWSVAPDESGVPRICLNNRPYFMHGLLDQGYWSDGLLTAPGDEAMIYDIETMKSLGFNTLRKHIKLEPMRWYYHCDRLGMAVWQDMVNGGGAYHPAVVSLPLFLGSHLRDTRYRLFGRGDADGRAQFERELRETVEQLGSVPSIAVWVPFNEGWGQFDAARIADELKALDPDRLVDHASGWYDQGAGDFKSLHVYFKPYRFRPDRRGRAVILSEFGGYALRVEGHCFNKKDFGYSRCADKDALTAALRRLYAEEIAPAVRRGLSACIYTQVSDVEDELNGLLTYDRRVCKLTPDEAREAMDPFAPAP